MCRLLVGLFYLYHSLFKLEVLVSADYYGCNYNYFQNLILENIKYLCGEKY